MKKKTSKLWLALVGWGLAAAVMAAAIIAVPVVLRMTTPVQVPAADLEVWYMKTGDVKLDVAKKAALDQVAERFTGEYSQVTLRIKGVPQAYYAEELAASTQVDVFESTGLSLQELEWADSVAHQMRNIPGDAYLSCDPETEAQFPVGLVVPVIYVNSALGELESPADLEQLRQTCMKLGEHFSIKEEAVDLYAALYGKEAASYCEETAKDDFVARRSFVYLGDSMDYFEIQNAMPGEYKVLMPNGRKATYRYGMTWSVQADNEQEYMAAKELLFCLTSDLAQDWFYVRTNNGQLPLLKKTMDTYAEVYGELSVVKDYLDRGFAAPVANGQELLDAADRSALDTLKAGASAVFHDVPADSWYTKAVTRVYAKGLMEGASATAFEPESAISKFDLITALYRVSERPEIGANAPFHDVDINTERGKAAVWAYENGIVSGNGEGSFRGEDPVDLETCMLLLYRYAEKVGYDMTIDKKNGQFADGSAVGGWANDSVMWAISHGLFSVQNGGTISPHAAMTRGRFAVILENMLKQMPV